MNDATRDLSIEDIMVKTQPYNFGVPYLETGKVYVEFMVWHTMERKPTKYRLQVARVEAVGGER